MFPIDIIKENLLERIDSAMEEVEHDIKFENPAGNQWNIILSFDLDKAHMSDTEKMLIGALLKHL